VIRRQVHEFSGLEFDWLACDQDGFVGTFSSAGFGPVPDAAIQIADSLDEALDRIKARLTTGGSTSISGRTDPDDWIATARRGLFAFDWDHMRDRYRIEGLPSRPVPLNDIKDDVIRQAAACVRIPVRFTAIRWLDWDENGRLSSGIEI
jgi:hypothetical protein